jgi:hypothetical protein
LAGYIENQIESGKTDIVPALAAASLRCTEAEVLGLLMLFEKERMVVPAYKIYCKRNRTLLKTVCNKENIPTDIYCKFCDEEHADPDELEVELVFQVRTETWELLHNNAPAL